MSKLFLKKKFPKKNAQKSRTLRNAFMKLSELILILFRTVPRNYIGMAVTTLNQYPAQIWAESAKPAVLAQSATIARFFSVISPTSWTTEIPQQISWGT